ncbi:MAG: MucR family transcriptional regulator [Syntrophobacteraceae bacterium]|nr:MucR family transcriptional regulator [Syntrophobacteraceae bacterium]
MKKLLDIAAEIVQAQASVGQMSAEQIEQSLLKTFSTLQRMQKAEEKGAFVDSAAAEEIDVKEAFPARKEPQESIQDDKIICLECGTQMKQLTTKHLSVHNLTPREYKQKWGFSLKQPLSARSLTKARSKAAKKRGLPENLVKFLEERKQKKAEATAAVQTDTDQGDGRPAVKRRPKARNSA